MGHMHKGAKGTASPSHKDFILTLLTGLLSDEPQEVSYAELEALEATLMRLLPVFVPGSTSVRRPPKLTMAKWGGRKG